MAYLSSNAPIGPNSLQAADVVSDACILTAQMESAKGRADAFLTVPPLSSFSSPQLAANAAKILNQSREGRASILAASSPDPVQQAERVDLAQLIAQAPEVVSLNGRGEGCGTMVRREAMPEPPQMIMPLPIESGGWGWSAGSGFAGYAPPWGDANLLNVSDMAGQSDGSWFKWLMIGGGLVILGTAVTGASRARKRRLKR